MEKNKYWNVTVQTKYNSNTIVVLAETKEDAESIVLEEYEQLEIIVEEM